MRQPGTAQLADSLKRAGTGQTQLHLFYAHCMGISTSKANADTQYFEVSEIWKRDTCAAKTAEDSTHPNRFTSYAWISKRDILDWGFADALLAVGSMQEYIVEGIREVVLASVTPTENQEFVIVSHSPGSYLIFSALDLQGGLQRVTPSDWESEFEKLLSQSSHAYFLANQTTKEPNSRARAMRTKINGQNGRGGCPRPIGFPVTFLLEVNPDE